MITVGSDIDTFILSDGQLIFRKINLDNQSVEIIEINGEDTADLAMVLPLVWEKGITVSRLVDFFGGKYSEDQIQETVNSLISCGVFSDELNLSGIFIKPLKLHEFSSGHFLLRIDCSIYLISAGSLDEAKIIAKRILRRWGTEDNMNLIREAIQGKLQCFPAKCINRGAVVSLINTIDVLPERTLREAYLSLEDGQIVLKHMDSFKDARRAFINTNGYWTGFISRVLNSNLIASVREVKTHNKSFQLSKIFFISSHILPNVEGKAIHDFQVGLGMNREEACGKALMESLERYCCEKRPDDLLYARATDLAGFPMIDPNQLAGYLDSQLFQSRDLKNFSAGDDCFWTEVFDIQDRPYRIPACHIWYCFNRSDFPDGRSLFWSSTNGAAAHFSYEKAVLLAVQEVIERDAIMIWWLNRLSPPIIDRRILGERLNIIVAKIETHGFELQFLDLTLDLLPVCMVVARNRSGKWPYFFCGAACNIDFIVACEKALAEIEHAIWDRSGGEFSGIEARDLYYPMDHEQFYLDPDNGKTLDFLFEGANTLITPNSVNLRSVQEIQGYLREKGFNLFLRDITCPEIREAGIDMCVVKTVIPELVPITFGFMTETLSLPRIYSLPVKLGLRQKSLTESDVIKDYQPHFFS